MQDKFEWIEVATQAAAQALERNTPCLDPGDIMPASEWQIVAQAALRAFFDHVPLAGVPLQPAAHHYLNAKTLRLLKSAFTEPTEI
jgi:hypothetical protein